MNIWNDTQYHISLGNYKLKQQEDTNVLEWLICKTLTTLNADEDVVYSLLVDIQNGTATLEEILAVS